MPVKRRFLSGDHFIRRCMSKCSVLAWSRTCATHGRKRTTFHIIKMHNQLGCLHNNYLVDNPCLCSNKTGLNTHMTALFAKWRTSSTMVNLMEFFLLKWPLTFHSGLALDIVTKKIPPFRHQLHV